VLFSRNAMVKEVEPEKVHLKTQEIHGDTTPHPSTSIHIQIILTTGHDVT